MQILKKPVAYMLIITLIISLSPMTVMAKAGTEYEVSNEIELSSALASLVSDGGGTIKLTEDIDYTSGISIYGISITFNLDDGHKLNISNNSGDVLSVSGGGEVKLKGSGALNVTAEGGSPYGVYVSDSSSATVTNAYAIGDYYYGAYASNNGSITVTNNVSASGMECSAAYADNGGNILVGGKAIANGVKCNGAKVCDGIINIEGNTEVSGIGCYGINVNDGSITVKGDVTAADIACQGAVCSISSSHSLADIKGNITVSGDYCYGISSTSLGSSIQVDGTVNASGQFCYGAYATGGGIIMVSGSSNINGDSSYSVYAYGTDSMIQVGQDVAASGSGVYAVSAYTDSVVTVGRNVLATGAGLSYGAYTDGGSAAIGGDITAGNGDYSNSAYAVNGGVLTVSGSAIAEGQYSRGAYARGLDSTIVIGQDITDVGDYCYGAFATDGGKVKVGRNVTVTAITAFGGVNCARAETGGKVTVNGNAASIGSQSQSAFASDTGSCIVIEKSVTATGEYCQGISLIGGSSATVNGNISINSDYGIGAKTDINSTVIVNGYINANGTDSCGVLADHNSSATVSGIITSKGINNRGASAANDSAVTVDGGIDAICPIILDGLNIDSSVPEVTGNYLVYVHLPQTATICIKLPMTPVINTNPQDLTRYENEQAVFTVSASAIDGGILTYQWQKSTNGGSSWSKINGATATALTIAGVTAGDNNKKYKCQIKNTKNGTSAAIDSNAATLTVIPTKTLVGILTPAAVTGLANGTPKTAVALGLPDMITMVTNLGNVSASVIWDVPSCSYNSSSSSAQTFDVTGSAILPSGVVNTNNVPLTIRISVSVLTKAEDTNVGKSSPSKPGPRVSVVIMNLDILNSTFDKTEADSDGIKQIIVQMPDIKNVNQYALDIPASVLNSEEESKRIKMTSAIGTILLPDDMLRGSGINSPERVKISMGEGDKSGLPKEVQEQIGSKPLVELKLSSGDKSVEWNNPGAPVTVSIPYAPTAAELKDPEHIVVWYLDGKGNIVNVPSGRYDAATGMVTFSTTHFSQYAIAYVTKSFDDLVAAEWARKPVEILASKGIVEGLSERGYAPKKSITRGDFLCFLIRALNIEASFDEGFADVSKDTYYYKEIGAAKKLGITSGIGKNQFHPDDEIMRQDMMVLTERTLTLLNKIKTEKDGSHLSQFSDKEKIAVYAASSIDSLVKEGLIVGSGSRLNPRGNTTRAEAAVFLYRIYEKYNRPIQQ